MIIFPLRRNGPMRVQPKQVILCIYVIVFIITWYWPREYFSQHEKKGAQTVSTNQISQTIHIVISIRGDPCIRRMITMLKSLLYYANRIRDDSPSVCYPSHEETPEVLCEREINPIGPQFGIHLHLLTFDSRTKAILNHRLLPFQLLHTTWSMYDINRTAIHQIPNAHWAGLSGLAKLLVPSTLPLFVNQVVLLDTDVIFNENILELWNHFDKFDDQQALGFVWEQQSEEVTCNHTRAWPIPLYGVNSGVGLLHLDRLRELDWTEVWQTAVKAYLKKAARLQQADQDVYNEIIRAHPELYYKLSCEWNVQLYSELSTRCCPSWWPDRSRLLTDCHGPLSSEFSNQHPVMACIVHFNLKPKPEDVAFSLKLPSKIWGTGSNMTRWTIAKRFVQAYHKFQSIPPYCFI